MDYGCYSISPRCVLYFSKNPVPFKKAEMTRCAAPADAMAQQIFLLPYGDIMRRNPASCKGGLSAQ